MWNRPNQLKTGFSLLFLCATFISIPPMLTYITKFLGINPISLFISINANVPRNILQTNQHGSMYLTVAYKSSYYL